MSSFDKTTFGRISPVGAGDGLAINPVHLARLGLAGDQEFDATPPRQHLHHAATHDGSLDSAYSQEIRRASTVTGV